MLGVHPQEDLAPRDVVAAAISRRMAEAPGGIDDHVFLDATHMGERFYERFPSITAACRAIGIDPARDRIPVAPAAHYACGGVPARLDGTTAHRRAVRRRRGVVHRRPRRQPAGLEQPHRERRRRHPPRPRPGVGGARPGRARRGRGPGRRRRPHAAGRDPRGHVAPRRVRPRRRLAGHGRRRARRRRRQDRRADADVPGGVGGDEPADRRRRPSSPPPPRARGEPRLPPPHRLPRAAATSGCATSTSRLGAGRRAASSSDA